ncbi:hypothetical protein V8G54_036922 [Vigna mungo]|uniref:Squalene cyclase N-terminal domain-containing protein n=1 Tax=Vigna mungo TaxID=3915 RepID=A0AAQ3RFW5_VIGMU
MEALITTIRRGISFYLSIQGSDGHWPAESAGPLFFLQPLVMALYITRYLDVVLGVEHKKEIVRYLYNHQNEDMVWGFHIEGDSTMFGSVLSYTVLRILGEGVEDGVERAMYRGRKWILEHGGLVAIPSWGKLWVMVNEYVYIYNELINENDMLTPFFDTVLTTPHGVCALANFLIK